MDLRDGMWDDNSTPVRPNLPWNWREGSGLDQRPTVVGHRGPNPPKGFFGSIGSDSGISGSS